MLYSDEEKSKLCNAIKMEKEKLPTDCVPIGHVNVKQVRVGWKKKSRPAVSSVSDCERRGFER